jgi:hypothetical protein
MNVPEGMIPVEEYARIKGITAELAVRMIKDGLFTGRLVGDQWYVNSKGSHTAGKAGLKTTDKYPPLSKDKYPPLSNLFFVLAGLSLIGGFTMCIEFWPGDAEYGNQLTGIAYTYSIVSVTVGVVQFALFTAIGEGLFYLKEIVTNTSTNI